MLRPARNKLLLGGTALALLLLLALQVGLGLRLLERNRALKHSVEMLEQHQVQLRKRHHERVKRLETQIEQQEALHKKWKTQLRALEGQAQNLRKQEHEHKMAIRRIRTADSLWHEIAGHYHR